MIVSESSLMFVNVVNCSDEVKDKHFIVILLKELIDKGGYKKVVQAKTNNVKNCKDDGEIIEGIFLHIYCTPWMVHALNLALKNICTAKNVLAN